MEPAGALARRENTRRAHHKDFGELVRLDVKCERLDACKRLRRADKARPREVFGR